MVTLIEIRTDELRSTLTADLTEEGDLLLSGHDHGPTVEKLLGDDEYEYWLRVRAADLPATTTALAEAFTQVAEAVERDGILEALRLLFADGTFEHDAGFREWLESRAIPTKFHSWR